MADEKTKAPYYKKWWFWLLVIIILLFVLFGTGNEEDPLESLENENEQTDTIDEEGEDPNANDDVTEGGNSNKEQATRDNSNAEETTLNAGNFIVGEDIPAGRYVMTGDGTGNLFVYDENGMPTVNEILDKSGEMGVTSVTTNLESGQEIEISGLNDVTFTPAETSISNTLSAGNWQVGLDIEPGRYNVTAPSGMGNFVIYDAMGLPATNEILDISGELGVKQLTVTIEDGQEIQISGINEVNFEPR